MARGHSIVAPTRKPREDHEPGARLAHFRPTSVRAGLLTWVNTGWGVLRASIPLPELEPDEIASADWEPALIRGREAPSQHPARRQHVVQYAAMGAALRAMANSVLKHQLSLAGALFPAACLDAEICQLQRTSVGGGFDWHRDTPPADRMLAFICYLNDDFKGGSTDFQTASGTLKSIKPSKGLCVAFDPSVRHRGACVERGTKYALVTILSRATKGPAAPFQAHPYEARP